MSKPCTPFRKLPYGLSTYTIFLKGSCNFCRFFDTDGLGGIRRYEKFPDFVWQNSMTIKECMLLSRHPRTYLFCKHLAAITVYIQCIPRCCMEGWRYKPCTLMQVSPLALQVKLNSVVCQGAFFSDVFSPLNSAMVAQHYTSRIKSILEWRGGMCWINKRMIYLWLIAEKCKSNQNCPIRSGLTFWFLFLASTACRSPNHIQAGQKLSWSFWSWSLSWGFTSTVYILAKAISFMDHFFLNFTPASA